jgi:AhpC/TSA antioxidant enzyme
VNRIPDPLLARYVNGVNLMPGTLRDQLGERPTLLVFLRHFGCPFCKETIASLRDVSQRVAGYPSVLFFYQGSPTEGRAFMRRYWPEARAVADPDMAFYDGLGVGRGGLLQMFHPGVIPALVRAGANGHLGGEGSGGDARRMPGLFVARGGEILWSHRARHQADHPEFERIPQLAGVSPGASAGAT